MKNNILYHGSTVVVKQPLTHISRQDLDFGPGFYVSNDIIQVERWARVKANRQKNGNAILNVYEFDVDLFEADKTFKTRIFTEYDNDWLHFVAGSRKGLQPWKNFDWIEGGIANDSVISTVDAFVDGFITAEQAIGQLVNETLRHQICIQNQSIVDKYLHFKNSIELK